MTRDHSPPSGALGHGREAGTDSGIAGVGDLDGLRRGIAAPAVTPPHSWQPSCFRLRPTERGALEALCQESQLTLIDTIDRQLEDLASTMFPSSGDRHLRTALLHDHKQRPGGLDAYGRWVYFPWDRTVVHLLDHDPFYRVITSRNQDKITRAEQDTLRTKRIGVMGLSVGGEAAVTLAQEHLCGEIRLADFDTLELSNLNRLNAGIDQLGCNKAVIAARRIAKIDPYLTVRIFRDGITVETAGAFLDGLDLLVEECDDLRLKFEIRRLARARNLDIVFAADERGFLSIEPYGSDPHFAPFHGRIRTPQPPRDSYPSPLAFMRALTAWMGGWQSISRRSRRSVEQIGRTLCGYPQLASEARFAAGQVGYVARRMLLGERLAAFAGNVDLDTIVKPAGT